MMWLVTYQYDLTTPTNSSVTHVFNSTNAITIGLNPKGLAFNTNRSKYYTVSQDEEKIYVLTVKDSAGAPRTVAQINSDIATIDLRTYLPDKDIPFVPNDLDYLHTTTGDYLVITTQGLKGAVVVPVE